MKQYIEIQVLSDPEFSKRTLMNALFSKLHQGLVKTGHGAIGVSFPDITINPPCDLGDRLRLNAEGSELIRLMQTDWYMAIKDHVQVGDLLNVPKCNTFRTFFRVQAKSNPERLRRRMIKRHSASHEESLLALPDNLAERLELPYIMLTSQSTGERFPLFVKVGESTNTEVLGQFSSYGLSRTATTPDF